MMFWVIWAILLVAQNGSHTLTSRARNSSNLWYNAVASFFSNGVWFVSQVLVIDKVSAALRANDPWSLVGTAVFYVFWTIVGSVGAHYLAMRLEGKH